MSKSFFETVIQHPFKVLLLILAMVAGAATGAQYLTFNDDYKVFFSEDNPRLIEYETVQRTFNKSDSIAFVIVPKDRNIFTETTLETIRQLTDEAWQIPASTRVDSITNYQHTWSEGDDLIVEDLVLEGADYSMAMLARTRHVAFNEPSLLNKLISEEGHVSVINVTVEINDPGLQVDVVAKAKALQAKYMSANPDIEILLSGMVMVNSSFSDSAIGDNATLVPLMFLVVIVLMILLLKTFSGTFATIIIVIASIMAAMGITGWIGIELSGPTASAPIMILTLAVADCIHVLSTMFFEMRQGKDKRTAILESLKVNLQPIILTSVTTAIGFLSMNFSDSPPFRDLGNIVAIGVMLACVLSLVLFPAILMLIPVKVKISKDPSQQTMLKLADFVSNQRNVLLPVMSVLVIALVALLPQNTLNDNFVKYFDESTTIRQTTDFMESNLSGIVMLEVAIDAQEQNAISEPEYLRNLDAFSQWFAEQTEVDHVMSLSDTFKRLNKNMHGDDDSYYRLPDSRELASQYLLLYEMSLPYGLDLNNQINIKKSSTRVIGTLKNLTSVELQDLEARTKVWFEQNAPDYQVMITGPDLMFAHIGQNNIKSMLSGTSIALLMISVLIGFALRSIRFSFISLLPNLAPAAMGFGVWYLIDGRVGIGLSVVAGMTLGIVVDYTVHFLSKYLYARRSRAADTNEAIHYAFANVGNALWVTTTVLVAGFLVMAQSTFKLNADMGFLTAITILLALIIDFFFLPPLIMKLDEKKASKKTLVTNTTE